MYAQLTLLFLELHLCCSRYGDLLELIHLNDLNYQKYCKAEYVQRHVQKWKDEISYLNWGKDKNSWGERGVEGKKMGVKLFFFVFLGGGALLSQAKRIDFCTTQHQGEFPIGLYKSRLDSTKSSVTFGTSMQSSSRSAVGRPTGNDVSGHYKRHSFLSSFSFFLSSTFLKTRAWTKN